MSNSPAPSLPNCPTCNQPVHLFTSVAGFVSYQCDNHKCDHFPATDYCPNEPQARAEWLKIVAINK